MRFRSLNGLQEQILKQQRHIEKKIQDALKADEHLGVLQRKSVNIKKQTNHKRISQISIIDEFYGGKDENESSSMSRPPAITVPHGVYFNDNEV